MKNLICITTICLITVLFLSCGNQATTNNPPEEDIYQTSDIQKAPITELKLQTLMKETLALAENVEIVVSNVEVPPNTALPLHFHPGEEFAYLLEGSGKLSLKDQEDIIIQAGEVQMVPFKHHHSFSSLEEGAKLLVFRVHEKGQPERVLIK